MGGILKNKGVEVDVPEDSKAFREQVLKNTQLNAKLQSEEHHRHSVIASAAAATTTPTSDDKLQWNKQNLADNEVIQQLIMENMETSIDEPKTPFQHATELNEYYKDDDDELEDFSLGAPELDDGNETKHVHVGVQVQGTTDHVLDRSKHMSFEEKKKMHYHHEAPQFHPVDDNEEETETAEPQQKKMSFAEMRKMHYSKEFEHSNADEDDDAGDDADEE